MPKTAARAEEETEDRVLIRLPASPLRRWTTMVLLAVFAAIFLQVGFELPLERPIAKIGAMLLGLAVIWQGVLIWRAGGRVLELTTSALIETGTGRVLARIEDIDRLDRSIIAWRPATGFLILLKQPASGLSGTPGMWWRIGRRIGVGGITPKLEGKAMAELLDEMLRSRAEASSGAKAE